MRQLILVLILLLTINFSSAICSEGQIDINTASLEKLDELSGIGPVKAQAIIDTRPLENIDKLINVVGIGEVTLQNIKTQGLACVEDKEEVQEVVEDEVKEEIVYDDISPRDNSDEIDSNFVSSAPLTRSVSQPITLSSKDIKSEIDKSKSAKNWFAIYGLTIFCILLATLFIIRIRKNGKNEFR